MQFPAVLIVGIVLLTGSTAGVRYEVSVYTGDKFGAGTDAGVFIKLYGKKGHSRELELDSKSNDFERGSVDTFRIRSPDVGKLKAIGVRHDNRWLGSSWYLHKITVKTLSGCVFEFPCDKWLGFNVGDGKISRILQTKSRCHKKPSGCTAPLGVSSGLIKDAQMTASSSYDAQHRAYHARLNRTVKGSRGGWCSAFADTSEYLEIDLGSKHVVTGIATQGQSEFDNWVTRFIMAFSLDGIHWEPLKDNEGLIRNLTGNSDRETVMYHWFPGLKSRYVRVEPSAWSGLTNCIRVELFGCENDTTPGLVRGRKPSKGKEDGRPQSGYGIIPMKQDQYVPDKEHDADLNIMSVIEKAVTYLEFERIVKDNVIVDASEQHNNARIVNFARIARFSENCGNGVDLNGGDILWDGATFHSKPRYAVTIATWMKMFSVQGSNSIFDTIGGVNSTHDNGQYHFEIIDGSVRWFHRNERNDVIFNVTSEVVVSTSVWTHVAVTYDSSLGQADVYVNAKFVMRADGAGELSTDWDEKAGIGEHKGERFFAGLIDEFYMSTEALSQEEIKKLMQHCAFEKECFSPLGMEAMRIQDKQITASSAYRLHKPFYGRLNRVSFYGDPRRTAWCADEDDKAPYMTVDLREVKTISGAAVQGASVSENFVTSFKLCHSVNGRQFECVGQANAMEALQGNEDKDSVMIHWLERFFDARYIRVYPLSWYGENICLRIELYGCITGLLSDSFTVHVDPGQGVVSPPSLLSSFGDCSVSCGQGTRRRVRKCQKRDMLNGNCYSGNQLYIDRVPCTEPSCPECFAPIGLSDGMLAERDVLGSLHVPRAQDFIAGAGEGDRCTGETAGRPFLEIDLQQTRKVTGVGTEGHVTNVGDQWTMRYYVAYSLNGKKWNNYTEDNRPRLFRGSEDSSAQAVRHLRHPVTARFVRLLPLLWHGVRMCIKVYIYGCEYGSNSLKPLTIQHHESRPPQKGHVPRPATHDLSTAAEHVTPDNTQNTEGGTSPTLKFTKHLRVSASSGGTGQAAGSLEQSTAQGGDLVEKPSVSPIDSHKFYGTDVGPFDNTLSRQSWENHGHAVKFGRGKAELSHHLDTGNPGRLQLDSRNPTLPQEIRSFPQVTSTNAGPVGSWSHPSQSGLPDTGQASLHSNSAPRRPQSVTSHVKENAKPPVTRPNVTTGLDNQLEDYQPAHAPERQTAEVPPGSVGQYTGSKTKLRYTSTGRLAGGLMTNVTARRPSSTVYSWSLFHECSVTCGTGVKKRYRKCRVSECEADGVETEILPCFMQPCAREASQWSAYSPCPVTCGVGRRTRFRLCDGVVCPKSGQETDTITCTLPPCPVLYLGFENWENRVVIDGSSMGNNAYLESGAQIVPHEGFCGHFADLRGSREIILEDNTFRRKPREGITIAAWANIQEPTTGLHTLFSTASSVAMGQIVGGYHFEIDDGRVRWFHRSRLLDPVFSVLTEEIIPSDVWSHIVGTYNATTGEAKVYVDSLLRGSSHGYGNLDQHWGYKAAIGNFDLGERHLRGWVDDFYMFDYAVSTSQVEQLLQIQCPGKI